MNCKEIYIDFIKKFIYIIYIINDNDPYNLKRFVKEQNICYEKALNEIKLGQKTTHWMWYIFPQIFGIPELIGRTSTYKAKQYSIKSLDEAKEYLKHPILRARLLDITSELIKYKKQNPRKSSVNIFGKVDSNKLKSCMTLFSKIDNSKENIFKNVIDSFFNGKEDNFTTIKLNVL